MADDHHPPSQSSLAEYIKFASVLGLITLTAGLAGGGELAEFLRWFMGVFLVTFSAFKFIGYNMFTLMFSGYDLLAKRSRAYARAYPFIELILGLSFMFDLLPTVRNLAVIGTMGVGSIGVIQEIYHRRRGVYCACLGNIIKLPLSSVSLVEDVAMVAMAGYMLTV
ncbi:MAG TPA: MauE/DoxX family redox-associated membrane protein [Candidatus Saccharimonadales bacterium]